MNKIKFFVCAGTAAVVLAAAPVVPSVGQAAPAATETQAIPLAPNAPERYVVQQGDTLWDIAARFLRDPWFWPEIWYINPQVENPHLIYPGDQLVLVYVDGKPRVMLDQRAGVGGATRLSPRVRSEPLSGAIPAIPYDVVARFVGHPTVLAKEQIHNAPYVVRTREDHLIAAAGNDAYVRRLEGGAIDDQHNIYHVGRELRDPDDGDVLGYEGVYNATGRITRLGNPATLRLTESKRESLDGDLLLPATAGVSADFVPRAPAGKIDGRIMTFADSSTVAGQYEVVVVNRGKRHGLEPGHTLGIWRVGATVRDRTTGGIGSKVTLPDERAGVVVLFKVYDRMSYGLVMRASSDLRVGDAVRNP